MKKIEFVKVNPTENITILVKTKCEKDRYIEIAQKLMSYGGVYAEQVGFIEGNNLQMMGGEFCGNATRSFASYLAFCDEDFKNEKDYLVTCSNSKPLSVKIRATNEKNKFMAKVSMPKIVSYTQNALSMTFCGEMVEISKIEFNGIVHYIVNVDIDKELFVKRLIGAVGKKSLATGIMFIDYKKGNSLNLTPYVYVRGMHGVWEHSCGSGTTAVAYYMQKKYNLLNLEVKQPGGTLYTEYKDELVYLDGEIKITSSGVAYL